ncbi:MAG: hypothetical protein EXR69_09595 [Myxococcales bacterium]|nr:hypothetical protein [Myxococcales bacterium]
MKAACTVTVHAPPSRLLSEILDFPAYPLFISDMRRAVVVQHSTGGTEWTVAFEAEVVRALNYTLQIWRAPDLPDGSNVVRWSLVDGALFKANEGSWTLRPLDGPAPRTLATYEIRVELGVFVPASLMASLIGTSLPGIVAAFKARAEGPPG